ncbi:hypothetical protein L798_13830 [Zootermopsis nevadensis]|uniref:Uncharacterized protein n=1 Tax=Zootermopsis nevadensis TaxID=136037 RepID=A0A067R0J3_ZOONE|nr:hypothetical protein L798_13830 [Zootermopsis nevadensis]
MYSRKDEIRNFFQSLKMDEGLSGISAGASVDIKRTDGEYLG